jgi:cyclophilin family peptidyl-prolyl cis-trans isomerase
MLYLSRTVLLPLLCLATALGAQQETEKPKSSDKPKAEKPKKADDDQKKQDSMMAKDPAIRAIDKAIDKSNVNKKDPSWRTRLQAPALVPFDRKTTYYWHLETSEGPLKVELFADTAPMHVTCGIYLTRLGYYDGLKFHRIIKQFMAQGGCPQGTGGGGPGYTIEGEFYGDRKHDKPGVLSTANTGMPKTDGSQFFLTFVPTPHLDGKHTIWGEVVDGMDTLKALEAAGSAGDGPVANPPTIVRAWISIAKDESKPDDKKAENAGSAKAPAEPEETPK